MSILAEKRLAVGGVYKYEHIREGKVIDSWTQGNIVVDEGLIYILNTAVGNVSQQASWYIGLFKNNYTPLAADAAATFASAPVANEATTEYSEGTRPVFTPLVTNAKVISNTATAYTFTAAVDIYGGFLISDGTKGGTSGTLLSASKFASVRPMQIADTLNVGYELSIQDI